MFRFTFALSAVLMIFATKIYGYDAINNSEDIDVKGIFEDTINKTLQNLKEYITDPIDIKEINLAPSNNVLNGTLDLYDIHEEGLKDFLVPFIHMQIIGMRVNMTIQFPTIKLSNRYLADLLYKSLVPLFGYGNFKIDLKNLDILISSQVDLKNGTRLKNLRVEIDLEEISITLTGLLYNEKLCAALSWILSQLFVPFLQDFQEPITQLISPLIENLINEILNGNNGTELSYLFPELGLGKNIIN